MPEVHGFHPASSPSNNPDRNRINIPLTDPMPHLRAAHIPAGHDANTFYNTEDIRSIKSLANFWGTYSYLRDLGQIPDCLQDNTAFQHVCRVHNNSVTLGYFQTKKAELMERGYTIIEGIADPANTALYGASTLPFTIPDSIPMESQDRLFDALLTTLDR